MKIKLFRHGDVLIKTTDEFKLPKGLKFKAVKILHKGNNHDHYFSKGSVESAVKGGKRYLKVKTDSLLSHGRGKSSEHATKELKKGSYWVEIQTEFDHLKKISRQVID